MKLTKKKKEEVLEIYTIWLHSYLNGDVATYHQYLDDAYHFIGSTNNEEFLDRNATTTFFEATADQLAGKCQLKEEKTTVEAYGDLVFITHVFDAWFLNGSEWNYYSRFRFSSVLQEKKAGWRFIYQHFSTTDNKADAGETIGFDKVNLENQELREAIKRRTVELEAKNRALEIEGALDRIRAQAVAMQQSTDLLDIVVIMRNEFTKLGHEAHYFWHMMWLPETYEKAMTSGDGSKIGFVMTLPRHMHGDIPLLANWEKSDDDIVIYPMNAKAAIGYVDKMVTLGDFKNIDPQAPTHDDIRHIGGLTFIMARTTHGEIGYSLPGVVKNPPAEDIDILVQFAGAFDLAHRRFLDLQKAEKQAREVQIELALEKVRSRTMAMQHSDELQEASFLLDQQVRALGIRTRGCAFNIYGQNDATEWFSSEEGTMPVYRTPRENVFLEYYEAGKRGESLYIKEFEGDTCAAHYDYLCTLPVMGKALRELKANGGSFPEKQIDHVTFFKYGYLLFITLDFVPEAHDIFKRFAKVFEQTYIRFLDLQKAEAQAIEKEIELALEKVRSRTMAMQNSEELEEVILEVLKKLQGLGISMDQRAAAIFTYETGNKEYKQWVASPEYNSILSFNTPYFDHPVQNDIWNARQNGTAFYAKPYPVEVKNSLFKYMFDLPALKNMPKAEKTKALKFKHYAISIAFQKHAALVVVDHSGIHLTEAENRILIRLSKVFNQTYTRFLDLQKAEAQAREAQIQLSLERVRAKSMAMQSSSELENIIQVVHDQFVDLGITLDHAGFIIDYKSNDDMIIWLADEHKVTPQIRLPFFDSPHWNSFITAKKQGHKLFVNHLDFKTKNKFYKQIFKYVPELPEDARHFYLKIPSLTIATALIDTIGLYIENFSGIQYQEEDQKILFRFGEEFQRAYTRFLDLQKAEAQAREAQIQLSLERVRAKSMAMQSSDELHDVIGIVFQQFDKLAIQPVNVFLSLFDREKRMLTCRASGKSGKRIPTKQDVDIDSVEAWTDLYNKWINDSSDDIEVIFYPNEIVPDILNLLKDTFLAMPKKDRMTTKDFPNGGYSTLGYTPFGYLGYDHTRPPTEEEKDILKRICTEFGRVYQRFLDIQKAEAQAREAQIEVALERTRTQSMLMQHSDELSTTTQVFHEQLQVLGIDSEFSYLWLPDEAEKNHLFWATWDEQKKRKTVYRNKAVTFPLDKNEPAIKACYAAWESEETVHVNEVKSNEVKEYFNTWTELLDGVEKFQPELFPDGLYYIDAYMSYGCFGIMIRHELSAAEKIILSRFSKEFQRTYTRFLDLQKAEAQAREAQIEAALERVRSASMAMHKTEDLSDVVMVYFEQLKHLDIDFIQSWITIFHLDQGYVDVWFSPLEGIYDNPRHFKMPSALFKNTSIKSWKAGLPFSYVSFPNKENVDEFMQVCDDVTGTNYFGKTQGILQLESFEMLDANHKYGCISKSNTTKASSEEEAILQRFANVFEQTYTRFLDLQKAEVQAREAQIEAALEKVRSRSLAMHNPEELQEVVAVVAKKLKELGVIFDAGGVILCTYFPDNKDVIHWISVDDFSSSGRYFVPYFDNPIFNDAWDSKMKGDAYFSKAFPAEAKNEFFKHAFANSDYKQMPEDYKQFVLQADSHNLSAAWSKNSAIIIPSLTGAVPSVSDANILTRFAKVFEQAYIRFLDLQKAEAQAREAQIEASLERVRAKAMAMHQTDELTDVLCVLFDQFDILGINPVLTHLTLFDEENETFSLRITTTAEKRIVAEQYIDINAVEAWKDSFANWKKSEPNAINCIDYEPEALPYVWDLLSEVMNALPEGHKIKPTDFPDGLFTTQGYFKFGYIGYNHSQRATEEEKEIVGRFAREFGRTYQRFLDLKKAEAQAREAKIEGALEHVRSQSMGMQSTNDFGAVTTEMFNQLRNFGEDLFATGIVFCDKHEGHVEQWHSIPGGGMLTPMIVPVDLDYIHQYRYDQWEEGKELFSIEIPSDFIEQHFEDIFNLPSAQVTLKDLESRNAPMPATPSWEIDYGASFKHGYILASSLQPLENMDILPRFAKVFEQAYTRFLDLQTAEKNAYKSKVEAALERVRSRAMAMQEPEELKDVAHILRTEMGLLGFEELETSSIYILDKKVAAAECWYAIKDSDKNKKLVADHISMDFKATWVGKQMLEFHDSKTETTSIVMKGDKRKEWITYCMAQSKVLKDVYSDTIPDRTYHLQKFSHGAIGAASAGDISAESWALLKRSASVFSLAYARFKDLTQARIDLKKLKAAKKRAEEALSELQQTQTQLIQSEKMASLGELTAGIAHEIQNPLNFVNNFSEVSKELLEEMQEEIENGDFEEVKAIMEDVIQNLEKINHHGKRADGIVKGMLQHSRSSSGTKEPTDINALADEYLRLAYHGLRAKDKSFNAELVTDFDEAIGKINVLPQDMGRVILNLITNAFYASNERKQASKDEGFKPTVSVSTKKVKDSIEISVKDNGNGIPAAIVDKIFQPFFTTKPTGQGTGLGLSMSYDIVTKGHGGELKVETEENEGTGFSIHLPLNK